MRSAPRASLNGVLTTSRRSNHNGVDAGVLTLPLADAVLAETSTGQDVRTSAFCWITH